MILFCNYFDTSKNLKFAENSTSDTLRPPYLAVIQYRDIGVPLRSDWLALIALGAMTGAIHHQNLPQIYSNAHQNQVNTQPENHNSVKWRQHTNQNSISPDPIFYLYQLLVVQSLELEEQNALLRENGQIHP